MIASVSSCAFAKDGSNYFFARDYLTVKVWDVRNNEKPVKSIKVTDYAEKNLCELYEKESIFDKF